MDLYRRKGRVLRENYLLSESQPVDLTVPSGDLLSTSSPLIIKKRSRDVVARCDTRPAVLESLVPLISFLYPTSQPC